MSEDNFLCLTLEDDYLAGLPMLDLELHFLQILPAIMEMDSLKCMPTVFYTRLFCI